MSIAIVVVTESSSTKRDFARLSVTRMVVQRVLSVVRQVRVSASLIHLTQPQVSIW